MRPKLGRRSQKRQFPSSWKSGNEAVSSGCIPNSIKNQWTRCTSSLRRNGQNNNDKLDMPTDEMGDIPPPSYQSPVKHAGTQTIDEPTLPMGEDIMTGCNSPRHISQGPDSYSLFYCGLDDTNLDPDGTFWQDSPSDEWEASATPAPAGTDPHDPVVYTVQTGVSESELSQGGTTRKREYTWSEMSDLQRLFLEVHKCQVENHFLPEYDCHKLRDVWLYGVKIETEEDRQKFDDQLDSLYNFSRDQTFYCSLASLMIRAPAWC
ncbi:hypothetical protein TREMEDRAFT_59205 [Tremella mesenterica DSM 1558]|uniref:uncharacterized protein n=1 Tax=Tremella mesenterica (strain ATCC 24925 / CBS 8224 / DSM 1558 / NBRC 9311 / NRRL Y-6157 / RJB 2259-6 / UBC 559-6) TaxID=578456 RepID=UPI0003F494E1|nr:uncharacterized protein TREMEDRAFT_59205 [Tremella mesenterica DSM 1558]EIW73042.1 hypothetical protein TREMEDRAFT_59205 [Tremella mesenterica DSM 1558]